jgi:hypothetical protein
MQIKIDLSIIRSRVYLKYIELRALMLDITYPSFLQILRKIKNSDLEIITNRFEIKFCAIKWAYFRRKCFVH